MGSMSSVTPFLTIAVSSSLVVSSKVNPYWNPEHPPPVTNTRSFRSGLPSSSIRDLTLAAALSENVSGAGISVMSFIGAPRSSASIIGCLPGRRNPVAGKENSFGTCALQFDYRRDAGFGVVEASPEDGADVHFKRLVAHVSRDSCLRLQLDQAIGDHRPDDLPIHDHVRDTDLALNFRVLANDQRARLGADCNDVAEDLAVDPQSAAEGHISKHRRSGADQRVDALLRCPAFPALPHGTSLRNHKAACRAWRRLPRLVGSDGDRSDGGT